MNETIRAALDKVMADLPGCYPEELPSLQAFARDTFATALEGAADDLFARSKSYSAGSFGNSDRLEGISLGLKSASLRLHRLAYTIRSGSETQP